MDRAEIERFVQDRFHFLKQYSFTERVNVWRKSATTNIIFRSDAQQLGICVSLDFEHFFAGITIAQLERGEWRWPNRFFNTFHEKIEILLRESLKIDEPALATIEQMLQQPERDNAVIEKVVALYGGVVEQYIYAILQQPRWMLFPQPTKPLAKWMGQVEYQVELLSLEIFASLMQAKGFIKEPIFKHYGLASDITWRKDDIGIQLGFDWRDGYVHLYFQRLITGKVPEHYWDYNWEYEKLVRDYLGDEPALDLLRHIDNDTPFSERGYSFAEAMLIAYLDLVSRTLDVILEQVVSKLGLKSRADPL